jgi:hypothetical protein
MMQNNEGWKIYIYKKKTTMLVIFEIKEEEHEM